MIRSVGDDEVDFHDENPAVPSLSFDTVHSKLLTVFHNICCIILKPQTIFAYCFYIIKSVYVLACYTFPCCM